MGGFNAHFFRRFGNWETERTETDKFVHPYWGLQVNHVPLAPDQLQLEIKVFGFHCKHWHVLIFHSEMLFWMASRRTVFFIELHALCSMCEKSWNVSRRRTIYSSLLLFLEDNVISVSEPSSHIQGQGSHLLPCGFSVMRNTALLESREKIAICNLFCMANF